MANFTYRFRTLYIASGIENKLKQLYVFQCCYEPEGKGAMNLLPKNKTKQNNNNKKTN